MNKSGEQEYNVKPMTTMIDKSILKTHLFYVYTKTFTYYALYGTFYDKEWERERKRVSES